MPFTRLIIPPGKASRRLGLQLLLLAAVMLAGFGTGTVIRRSGWPGNPGAAPTAHGSAEGAVPETSLAGTTTGHGKTVPSSDPAGTSFSFSMKRFQASQGLEMHRLLARVLPDADQELVRRLAVDLWSREPMPHSQPVWKAVMGRWAALDCAAAAAWARERDEEARAGPQDDGEAKPQNLTFLAHSSRAETDLESMVAEASKNSAPDLRKAVIRQLAEVDPVRALPMAFEWGGGDCVSESTGTTSFMLSVLKKAAQKDPGKALDWLHQSGRQENLEALSDLARGWAVQDPAACGQWLLSLPASQREWAGHAMLGVAEENPTGAAAVMAMLPASAELTKRELELAGLWAEKSPEAALNWARHRFPPGPLRSEALARMANSVMKTDLHAAVTLMDESGWGGWRGKLREEGQYPQPVIGPEDGGGADSTAPRENAGSWRTESEAWNVIVRLTMEDPAAAVHCYEKVGPFVRGVLLSQSAPAWFQKQPDQAMQWLASLPAGEVKVDALTGMLGAFDGLSAEAMADWAQRLPAGPLTEALVRKAAGSTALTDPVEAMEKLPYTDPALRRAAEDEIVRQWAAKDPARALDWLAASPGLPATAPASCQPLVERWADYEPGAASAWTAALPPGPVREAAVQGLVASLSDPDRNPDLSSALAWSLDLQDPALRQNTARHVLTNLNRIAADTGKLRETISQSAGLSDAARGELLQFLPAPEPSADAVSPPNSSQP